MKRDNRRQRCFNLSPADLPSVLMVKNILQLVSVGFAVTGNV